jgi:uncharacterized SAM-binding protein YcdF (DUF218 family)
MSMMLSYEYIVVVLGCGNQNELIERVELGISLYVKHSKALLFFSGTPSEILFMKELVSKRLPSCMLSFEDKSRNTIDNIVNTFSMFPMPRIFGTRPSLIESIDEFGVPIIKEVPDYKFIVVSSDYHIQRVKLICDHLDVSKNRQISYYDCVTSDKAQLNKRLHTENYIRENIFEYISMIDRQNMIL